MYSSSCSAVYWVYTSFLPLSDLADENTVKESQKLYLLSSFSWFSASSLPSYFPPSCHSKQKELPCAPDVKFLLRFNVSSAVWFLYCLVGRGGGGNQRLYLFYIFAPISFTKEGFFNLFQTASSSSCPETVSEKRVHVLCNWCLFCPLNWTPASHWGVLLWTSQHEVNSVRFQPS